MQVDPFAFAAQVIDTMHPRQVNQSTFDAIVREAMTDFDLSAAEAVADAREQLSIAGITDFSNLIDPTSMDKNDILSEYATVSEKIDSALGANQVENAIQKLETLTKSDQKVAAVAGGNGAVETAVRALAHGVRGTNELGLSLVTVSCEAISALCSQNEANRTRFAQQVDPDGVELLTLLIRSLSNEIDSNLGALRSVVKAVVAVQRQCEGVKRRIAAGETPDALLRLTAQSVSNFSEEAGWADLCITTCRVLRQLLIPDDVSVNFAETFVRARLFAGAKVVSESGLRPLQGDKTLVDVLGDIVTRSESCTGQRRLTLLRECMSLSKLFAVSDEVCKEITDRGVGKLAIASLDEMKEDGAMVYACLGLMRSLSGRDACKSSVFGGMSVIVEAVKLHYAKSSAIAEVFCGVVSGLCLRRGDIGREIVENGVVAMVLEAMNRHGECAGVLKAGCLAIRNAVSRDEKARCSVVSDGHAEAVVRRAWKKFPGACDEVAYLALQELDVLEVREMRRDERYTMPAGFYQRAIVRKGENSSIR